MNKTSFKINIFIFIVILISITLCGCMFEKTKINFDSNGGSEVSPFILYKNEEMPVDPTKEGYVFDGWYIDNEKLSKPFTVQNIYNLDESIMKNKTVYAKWLPYDYVVNFVANGGSIINNVYALKNRGITKPDNPAKEGFVFGKWYTDNGTFENEFDFSNIISEDKTLYAKWSIYKKYTLIDNNNYEISKGDLDYNKFFYITSTYNGKTVSQIAENGFFNCDTIENVFLGSNINNICSGAFSNCEALKTITIENSNNVIDIGENIFANCPSFEKIYVPLELYEEYKNSQNWFQYRDLIYYKCEICFKVIYEDEQFCCERQDVDSNERAIPPDYAIFHIYAFDGWYTNLQCTEKFDFSTPITEDICLYAKLSSREEETTE